MAACQASISSTTAKPVDLGKRVRGRHLREGLQHGPDRFLGLREVVLPGHPGLGQGAANGGLQDWLHAVMAARSPSSYHPLLVKALISSVVTSRRND